MASLRFSPLALVLGSIFFFTSQVFAVSAVLGVDLGTEYIKAALVKPGIPLEIVLTKDSRRKEISAVTFKPPQGGPKAGVFPERLYGSDAMALSARFPADVYPNLKTLLGLPIGDSIVQEYAARHPGLQIEENRIRGTAAFKSKAFSAEEEAWMVEELLAMELQSIQKNAEATAGPDTSVRSIVVTVPPFFSLEEKRAVELAADLAGLKILSLISDGMAVGLNYATTRQFPNVNNGEKPEYHMVFDMGAGSTKASVLRFQSRTVKDIGKFNKTVQEVALLGAGWDRTLGGDALNSLIVDDMISQFVESKGAQKISVQTEAVKSHGRAINKLTKEAERLRHILSANSNSQANFEGLYEDVDFKYKIERTDFEKLAEAYAVRVGTVIQDALKAAQLELTDLDSVILHGGASRTPFVQKQLEESVGSADKLRSNVNSDESAVFGAGFRAAELSPSFRVKEIRLSEGAMYPSGIKWTNPKQKEQHQRLWSAVSPMGAAPKEVTFTNLEDFDVTFYQQIAGAERDVSTLKTQNLTETVAALKEKYGCEDSGIQFKVGVKLSGENGEVKVVKAAVECEAEVSESLMDGVKNLFGFGKKDQKPLADGEAENADSAADTSSTESSTTSTASSKSKTTSTGTAAGAEASAAEAKEEPKKKQIVSIFVKFSLEDTGSPSLSKEELKKSKDRLQAFEASDKARRQREEALNRLEGFTYKVRDLLDSESFVAASTEEERTTLETKSSEASDWLYGEGADASKDEFKAKYKELNDIVSRVQKRVEEAETRPELVKALKDALDQSTVFVDKIKDQIKSYEEFHAAAQAASSDTSTATEEPASSSSTDSDGVEDDATAEKPRDMEDVIKEDGPIPPLYKMEDVDVIDKLHEDISSWITDMEAKQAALPPTADPVLLAKDLKSRREKLDKAGVDLAMKGVKSFEKKNKKASSNNKKAKKTKTATAATAATGDASDGPEPIHINLGEDGKAPTEEEIQEILRKLQESQEPARERDEL
ncbi:hypothetical protein VDGE_07546 [Verticillium dahliae]|uniref:Stress protein ORP150 n=2 Tax=Verticillium TaxID=1036719 RepID=A0A444RLA8_VERDA|nr:hypothetical protein VDGE_07546 [Verticillium dahliae]